MNVAAFAIRAAGNACDMSLTVESGPFGQQPAGRFNTEIEPPGALLFWDPVPELVAESRRAHALFETALPPRYYFPAEDVRTDLLVPSSKKTRCAYKGRRRTGTFGCETRCTRTSCGRMPTRSTTPSRSATCSASSTSGSSSCSTDRTIL
jgi:hypothetical protein